jgi:hypothetical protein
MRSLLLNVSYLEYINVIPSLLLIPYVNFQIAQDL